MVDPFLKQRELLLRQYPRLCPSLARRPRDGGNLPVGGTPPSPHWVRHTRLRAGLSKAELARRMNLGARRRCNSSRGYRTITDWEKGRTRISPPMAAWLERACRASVEEGSYAVYRLTALGVRKLRYLSRLSEAELARRMHLGKRGYKTITDWEMCRRWISPPMATFLAYICMDAMGNRSWSARRGRPLRNSSSPRSSSRRVP